MHYTASGCPSITPFKDGAVDFKSYERLIEHYLALGVDGLFPLGTTGESPTLDEAEIDELVERTVATVAGRVPVFVGVGGNATAKVEKALKRLERHAFEGIVSVCPYYNRPSQDGLDRAFPRHRRGDRPRRADLQHPLSHGREPLQRLAARACRGEEHRRRQGQLGQHRPVARAAGAQAQGLLGADRRGRALLHHDGQRRGGRHPGRKPCHDRALRRGRPALRRQRRRRRPRRLGAARAPGAAAVRRGQPDADQVPAVAAGPDRLAGMPPAVDADIRRPGAAARRVVGERLAA